MREYGFSLTRSLPYKNRIVDSVLLQENMGQGKTIFSHILCSERVILIQKRKGKHDHRIQHFRISLGTKVHFKQTILHFWTKFTQKGISGL